MKKLLIAFLFVVFLSSIALADAPFHIGVMTSTVSQSEDAYRAGEDLIKEYGDVKDGGMINHLTFPDNFMTEMETTISQMLSFADDPLMKAVICSEASVGTVESFRKIREIRPDILLFAASPTEDPGMITEVADLSMEDDTFSRGYLMVLGAKKMGADTFMHISFPRHLSVELMSRRRDIMREASKDLGLKFVDMTVPDPLSEVGVSGTQQYILEKFPAWLEEYGKKTAFFTTNAAIHEPLIKRIVELGGFYVEAGSASPTMGFPGALGIKFGESERGNWPAILKTVEDAVVKAGAAGRLATWTTSFIYVRTVGMVEHAKRVIEGKSELLNKEDLLNAIMKFTPNATWNCTYYIDANGVVKKNFPLVYQDTYVLGRGFLNQTSEIIPEKYYDRNIGKK